MIEWEKIAHKGCNDRKLTLSFLILQANTNRTKNNKKIKQPTFEKGENSIIKWGERHSFFSIPHRIKSESNEFTERRAHGRLCLSVRVQVLSILHSTLFVSLHPGFDK